MKKVLFLFLAIMIALSSAGFAAVLTSKVAGDSGKMGAGFWGGIPTLRYNFSNSTQGQLGLSFSSGGGTSITTLLLGADTDVAKISGTAVNMGGAFYLTSAAGGSSWTAALTCGVDAMIAPSVVLELKVYPITLSGASGGGSTTVGILSTATVGAHIYL